MAMFGADPKTLRQNPFAFENAAPIAPPMGGAPLMPPAQLPEQKPGFFGQGGAGRGIAGGIGDFLLQQAGAAPIYAPVMQRQQMLQQQQALAERQRQTGLQDWVAKESWKRTNPEQTPFERDLAAAGIDPASPQGRALYQQRVTNQADPFQAVPVFDEATGRQGLSFIRPSEMGGRPAAPAAPLSPDEGGKIIQGAAESKLLTPEDAERIRQSLGPDGQGQFDAWRQKHGIAIGKRLSNGQIAYLVNGRLYDNPEGK